MAFRWRVDSDHSLLTGWDITPGRRQSKTLLSTNADQKSLETVFFGRQMAIENAVSNDFDLRLSIVLTFSIAARCGYECYIN